MLRIRIVSVHTGLLQTFRLSHALMESGIPLAIKREQVPAYRRLDSFFPGLDWKATLLARPYRQVLVDHPTPRTGIGHLERRLVFAHAIVDQCRKKWSERTVQISFAGLMTEGRRQALEVLTASFGDGFRIVATDAGRRWPGKALDDDYYAALGQSALTACPDGDFIWTYRFFEAALCGSIPVIQNDCSSYDGFQYYRMTDDPRLMQWDAGWAEHNAAVARERLTVPHDMLRAAILTAAID